MEGRNIKNVISRCPMNMFSCFTIYIIGSLIKYSLFYIILYYCILIDLHIGTSKLCLTHVIEIFYLIVIKWLVV